MVGSLAEGYDTGVMDEPMLRAWMMESVKPASHHETLPGRWIAELSWPSPGITPRRLFLTDEGLRDEAASLAARTVCSPQTVGNMEETGFLSVAGTIRRVTRAKTTCARWFSTRRRSMRR